MNRAAGVGTCTQDSLVKVSESMTTTGVKVEFGINYLTSVGYNAHLRFEIVDHLGGIPQGFIDTSLFFVEPCGGGVCSYTTSPLPPGVYDIRVSIYLGGCGEGRSYLAGESENYQMEVNANGVLWLDPYDL